MGWIPQEELCKLGFSKLGKNVLISDSARIYNAEKIEIGNNVRIDDFCVISAGSEGICIGDYVHIAIFSSLQGVGKITLSDFSGLSSRVAIYSSNEDYSGNYLTNPTVPDNYKKVKHLPVCLGKHVIVGSGSVILPGVIISDGTAIGSLSLVTKKCEEFSVYMGVPAKRIMRRKNNLLDLELKLREEE